MFFCTHLNIILTDLSVLPNISCNNTKQYAYICLTEICKSYFLYLSVLWFRVFSRYLSISIRTQLTSGAAARSQRLQQPPFAQEGARPGVPGLLSTRSSDPSVLWRHRCRRPALQRFRLCVAGRCIIRSTIGHSCTG